MYARRFRVSTRFVPVKGVRDEFATLRLTQLVDLCFFLLCRVCMMHGTGVCLPAFLSMAADAVFANAPTQSLLQITQAPPTVAYSNENNEKNKQSVACGMPLAS